MEESCRTHTKDFKPSTIRHDEGRKLAGTSTRHQAAVAQQVEHSPCKTVVGDSISSGSSRITFKKGMKKWLKVGNYFP